MHDSAYLIVTISIFYFIFFVSWLHWKIDNCTNKWIKVCPIANPIYIDSMYHFGAFSNYSSNLLSHHAQFCIFDFLFYFILLHHDCIGRSTIASTSSQKFVQLQMRFISKILFISKIYCYNNFILIYLWVRFKKHHLLPCLKLI